MARVLSPVFSRIAERLGTSLRRRQPTARQSLSFEFLAPFYVFAAVTMAVAAAFTWLHGHNAVVATSSFGLTLLYGVGAVAAFHGRAKLRRF